MPTVFFSYFLNGSSGPDEFEQLILRDVSPRTLAEESVESSVLMSLRPGFEKGGRGLSRVASPAALVWPA